MKKAIYILIIVILLGSAGLFGFLYFNSKTELESCKNEYKTLESNYKALESKYDLINNELESYPSEDEMDEAFEKAAVLDQYIVFVGEDDASYYHRWGCPVFEDTESFVACNLNMLLGRDDCLPCPTCMK